MEDYAKRVAKRDQFGGAWNALGKARGSTPALLEDTLSTSEYRRLLIWADTGHITQRAQNHTFSKLIGLIQSFAWRKSETILYLVKVVIYVIMEYTSGLKRTEEDRRRTREDHGECREILLCPLASFHQQSSTHPHAILRLSSPFPPVSAADTLRKIWSEQ